MKQINVVIDNVVIPLKKLGLHFVPPDLEKAIKYYQKYIIFGGKLNKAEYLKECIKQSAKGTKYINDYSKVVEELLNWDKDLLFRL